MPNPFENELPEYDRKYFGVLEVHATPVTFASGAEYTIPGILNKEGDPFPFKGKAIDPESKNFHVVLALTCAKQDGSEYKKFVHFMRSKKDKGHNVAMPTLQKAFGKDLASIWGKTAQVSVVEVEYEDGDYKRFTWKLDKVYASVEERKAAEAVHFEQFKREAAPNGHTESVSTAGAAKFDLSKWLPGKDSLKAMYQAELQNAGGVEAVALAVAAGRCKITPEQFQQVINA